MQARILSAIAVIVSISSCDSIGSRNIAYPAEQFLGQGWTCHTTPDEFKRAGVIVERTPRNEYYFYKELGPAFERLNGEFGFPTLTLESDFSISGLTKFITALGVDTSLFPVDISYESTYRASTVYGGVIKTVMTGASISKAVDELNADLSQSSSEFFIIRESVSASSAAISIVRNSRVEVGEGTQPSKTTPEEPLEMRFTKPIGICTLSQRIDKSRISIRGVSDASASNANEGIPISTTIRSK